MNASETDRLGVEPLPPEDVAALLNTLLESERAGAKALSAFLDAPGIPHDVRKTLLRVQRDEARNCGVLIGLLTMLGRERSGATGAFLEKALAISGLAPRLQFLNRGQAWVERRIREALPRIEDARVRESLEAMRDSHADNIAACEALLAAASR
jgi:nitronate monooxygenase